jgi:hypothetical protein
VSTSGPFDEVFGEVVAQPLSRIQQIGWIAPV